MKRITSFITFLSVFMIFTQTAFAHVLVKPGDVLTSSFQTFTVSVPNEKEEPVTNLKLLIPNGVSFVTPSVKPGWTITTEKDGEGESAIVKSITWTGGSIPVGLRDDFSFSAKAPDAATTLQWKAYQTYQSGVMVSWDQDPATTEDDDTKPVGPYSTTNVTVKPADVSASSDSKDATDRYIGIVALAISVIALGFATRKPVAKN